MATLPERHVIPVIGTLPAGFNHRIKVRRSVFELNAVQQALDHVGRNLAEHPDRVLAFDSARRMHKFIGQFAIRREQQESLGIEVQPPNDNPSCIAKHRKVVKHGWPTLGITSRRDFSIGLVVDDDTPPGFMSCAGGKWLSVDANILTRNNPITQLGNPTVDRYASVANPDFQLPARSESNPCQNFLKFFS